MTVYNIGSHGTTRGEEDAARRGSYLEIGEDFFDVSITPLRDRSLRVLLWLDYLAGTNTFCFPSNQWLCEKTGKRNSSITEIFTELEQAGWIWRTYTDETMSERIGFMLLRRVNPESPVTKNTPEAIDLATHAMLKAIEKGGQG